MGEPVSSSVTGGKGHGRRTAILVLTNLVSLACLIWAVHGLPLSDVREDIQHLDWRWIGVAAVSDVIVYFFQGWRWALLLDPITPVPVLQTTRAIFVGLFANEILPFRSGEVIRCYLQSVWSGIPLSVTLASFLIERIFDGVWLVLCLAAMQRWVGLPRDMVFGTIVLGAIVTIAAGLAAYAMYHKQHAHAVVSRSKWRKHLQVMVEDLHLIGHSRYLAQSAFVSLLFLLVQIIPFYALTQADGMDLSLSQVAVLTAIMRLSAAVPQAPGNLGGFQAFMLLALRPLGFEGQLAKSFSLIAWVAITLPLLIVGFVAVAISGARLTELQRDAHASIGAGRGAIH